MEFGKDPEIKFLSTIDYYKRRQIQLLNLVQDLYQENQRFRNRINFLQGNNKSTVPLQTRNIQKNHHIHVSPQITSRPVSPSPNQTNRSDNGNRNSIKNNNILSQINILNPKAFTAARRQQQNVQNKHPVHSKFNQFLDDQKYLSKIEILDQFLQEDQYPQGVQYLNEVNRYSQPISSPTSNISSLIIEGGIRQPKQTDYCGNLDLATISHKIHPLTAQRPRQKSLRTKNKSKIINIQNKDRNIQTNRKINNRAYL